MARNGLPPAFSALEPFVERWAVDTAAARAGLRAQSSGAERQAFYEAAIGRLPAALAHLDAKPLGAFDAREQRLMQLMLSLAHVAMAVEVQGQDEARLAASAPYVRITRAPSELGPQPRARL
jgi:hypothetical protein